MNPFLRVAAILVSALFAALANAQPAANVSLLPNDEAWKLLPPSKSKVQPLPGWARALARSLPQTTAAMLELDHRHRSGNPLGPRLAGMARWVAAHANESDYMMKQIEGDLARAGVKDDLRRATANDFADLAENERRVLAFARKLTLTAYKVTDAEVERLGRDLGEKKLVALVLLLAHANFQDRLVLALGLPTEEARPALDVRFLDRKTSVPPLKRHTPEKVAGTVNAGPADAEWRALDFDALQKGLNQQRDGKGRIRVPSWDEVKAAIPGGKVPPRPLKIKWSLVCSGYQPALAAGWSACTGAFRQEARQDRVFEESLFWVVTRTLHCYY